MTVNPLPRARSARQEPLTAAIVEHYIQARGANARVIDVKVDDINLVDYDPLLNTELAESHE